MLAFQNVGLCFNLIESHESPDANIASFEPGFKPGLLSSSLSPLQLNSSPTVERFGVKDWLSIFHPMLTNQEEEKNRESDEAAADEKF